VDKPDIRAVIHFNLPSTVEAYYQEVGRAGRDGKPARGILLYSPEDRALQEWFIENDAPKPEQTHALYRALPRGVRRLSPLDLQRETGMNDTMLKLALRQLEIAGAVQRLGDERGAMLVRVEDLVRVDLSAGAAETEQFRLVKRRKLAQMIRYAETNDCRRRFILDYFGDHGSADAPECCDNHIDTVSPTTRRAETEDEWIPLVILETVRTLERPLGRDKIAMIVRGSHAQEIVDWGYHRHKFYSKLKHLTLREIGDVIEQLVARGYLKTIGGEYPVIALTPLGEQTLDARAAIALNVGTPASQQKRVEKKAALKAGGTIERTLELAEEGLSVTQIAEKRGLTVGTVYSHLERLVAEGRTAPDRFIEPNVYEQIIAAMKQWDGQWLSGLKALLPEEISYDQIRLVVAAQKAKPGAVSAPSVPETSEDLIARFLSQAHPKPLPGPWRVGFALDSHSKFVGAQNVRTELGDLLYRFKYGGEQGVVETLAARLADFLRAHSEMRADLILPIPSTKKERPYDPVPLLARALGKRIGVAVNETALVKTRATELQKAMTNLAQKQANVRGAYCVADAKAVCARRVLLLDDFFDSGATLSEATCVLLAADAAAVCVLAVTKTIHAD
jgi:predicted amidophosphoribosyltransferase